MSPEELQKKLWDAIKSRDIDGLGYCFRKKVELNKEEDTLPIIYGIAIRCGLSIARLLIEHGADINKKDKKGETALLHALSGNKEGNTEVVELLFNSGAEVYNDTPALLDQLALGFFPLSTQLELAVKLVRLGANQADSFRGKELLKQVQLANIPEQIQVR